MSENNHKTLDFGFSVLFSEWWHKDRIKTDLETERTAFKKTTPWKNLAQMDRGQKWDGKQLLQPAVRASCSGGQGGQDGGIQRHLEEGGGDR